MKSNLRTNIYLNFLMVFTNKILAHLAKVKTCGINS